MTFMPWVLGFCVLSAGTAEWCASLIEEQDYLIREDAELRVEALRTVATLVSIVKKNKVLEGLEKICSSAPLAPAVVQTLRSTGYAIALAQELEWRALQLHIKIANAKRGIDFARASRDPARLCVSGNFIWDSETVLALRSYQAGIDVETDDTNGARWRFKNADVRRRLE
ncbi:MAG: hypothetical protein ABIO95_06675 [Bdellovibrionota bacterium]